MGVRVPVPKSPIRIFLVLILSSPPPQSLPHSTPPPSPLTPLSADPLLPLCLSFSLLLLFSFPTLALPSSLSAHPTLLSPQTSHPARQRHLQVVDPRFANTSCWQAWIADIRPIVIRMNTLWCRLVLWFQVPSSWICSVELTASSRFKLRAILEAVDRTQTELQSGAGHGGNSALKRCRLSLEYPMTWFDTNRVPS